VNKNSSYHPTILAFWFLPSLTNLIRFKPQVWQKQVFSRRNPTLLRRYFFVESDAQILIRIYFFHLVANEITFLENQIWRSRLAISAKLKLYNTCILPIFLYGSDCWAISKMDTHTQDRCTRPVVSAYAAWHQMVPICTE